MSSTFSRGIAICTYNRADQIDQVIQAVLDTKPENARLIVCDDGSTDDTYYKASRRHPDVTFITGENLGVGANKNRAMYLLRNFDFITILEDDLVPTESGWFEMYEKFALHTNTHHFCRVQDKFVDETVPDFAAWCKDKLQLTPIYGPTPRGDLTFFTNMVIRKVGAFHPDFKGVGHAHGQWSDRVVGASLVHHPNKWIDIKEAADKFIQLGDTSGGRWLRPPKDVKAEIKANAAIRKTLNELNPVVYIEPFLP
jgi:glycosyltransferase involved in cell wall biosynthesis